MTRVIGIDFSTTSTGIAIYADGDWATYTVKSSGSADDPMRSYYDRIIALVVDVVTVVQPEIDDLIVIEGLGFASRNKYRDRMQFAWHRLHEVLLRWSAVAEPLHVTPSSVKKLATGDGRADKHAMFAAVVDRLGFSPRSKDEADAVWVAVAGAEQAGAPIPVKPLPPKEAIKRGHGPAVKEMK